MVNRTRNTIHTFSEIIYPMTLEYRKHWSEWEAIRELVQNALDSNEEYNMYRNNGNLVIEDKGAGIEVRHLLFGVTEKNEGKRGVFGEGLKIALIVLKRLGYDVEILSNNLEIKVSTALIEDQTCLKILYCHNGEMFKGSRITIKNYQGPDFNERFRSGNFEGVVFSNSLYGQIIQLKPSEKAKLYVKDIYVCDLENAEFSYNLKDVRLEESRNVADQWSLNYKLGYLWCQVTSKELWVKLFKAFQNKKYEKEIKLNMNFEDNTSIIEAFSEVFPNAVLYTSNSWAREAKWRNKEVIEIFSESEHCSLYGIIETDKAFVQSDQSKEDIEVKEESLTKSEKRNLEIIRNLAKSVDEDQEIKVYLMEVTLGKAGNPIKINKSELHDLNKAVSTTIHELTHTYFGCDDLTGDMIYKLSDMGAKLLNEYLTSEFSTKLLASQIGKYSQYRISIPKELIELSSLCKGEKVNITIRGMKQ